MLLKSCRLFIDSQLVLNGARDSSILPLAVTGEGVVKKVFNSTLIKVPVLIGRLINLP